MKYAYLTLRCIERSNIPYRWVGKRLSMSECRLMSVVVELSGFSPPTSYLLAQAQPTPKFIVYSIAEANRTNIAAAKRACLCAMNHRAIGERPLIYSPTFSFHSPDATLSGHCIGGMFFHNWPTAVTGWIIHIIESSPPPSLPSLIIAIAKWPLISGHLMCLISFIASIF